MSIPLPYTRTYDEVQRLGRCYGSRRQRTPFKGRNFVTPNIIGLFKVGECLVELSFGKSIVGDGYLVGCTVDDEQYSKCCTSLEELEDHLKLIRDEIKVR